MVSGWSLRAFGEREDIDGVAAEGALLLGEQDVHRSPSDSIFGGDGDGQKFSPSNRVGDRKSLNCARQPCLEQNLAGNSIVHVQVAIPISYDDEAACRRQ